MTELEELTRAVERARVDTEALAIRARVVRVVAAVALLVPLIALLRRPRSLDLPSVRTRALTIHREAVDARSPAASIRFDAALPTAAIYLGPDLILEMNAYHNALSLTGHFWRDGLVSDREETGFGLVAQSGGVHLLAGASGEASASAGRGRDLNVALNSKGTLTTRSRNERSELGVELSLEYQPHSHVWLSPTRFDLFAENEDVKFLAPEFWLRVPRKK